MGHHPTSPPAAPSASPQLATSGGRARRSHRALTADAALALGTGALVAAAPSVSAGPVPYTVDFAHPAIPVGAANEAYLDCDDDAGESIPVTVTDPNNVATAYQVPAAGPSAGNAGRLFLEEGPDGLFSASTLGHWSVDVACPSYDVFTTGFDVVTPTLGLEISADRDHDCTTDETGPYLVGNRETMCYLVTNSSGQDIRSLSVITPNGTSFEYYAAGEFPAGTSILTGASDGTVVPFDGATIDGLFVTAELGQPGSGTFAASAQKSFSFNALPAPLEVQITTGLTAGTACPDAGSLTEPATSTPGPRCTSATPPATPRPSPSTTTPSPTTCSAWSSRACTTWRPASRSATTPPPRSWPPPAPATRSAGGPTRRTTTRPSVRTTR